MLIYDKINYCIVLKSWIFKSMIYATDIDTINQQLQYF